MYILGDFNINMYQNNKYIVRNDNTISSKFLSSDIKNITNFAMHGFKQLIKSPTHVTCSTSTLIDHILASFPARVSQKGVIDVGISDHQLIYCTRKISRLEFPNYEPFDDVNGAYWNFYQKIMTVIDKIAPYRNKRIKGNTQKWFDSELLKTEC